MTEHRSSKQKLSYAQVATPAVPVKQQGHAASFATAIIQVWQVHPTGNLMMLESTS